MSIKDATALSNTSKEDISAANLTDQRGPDNSSLVFENPTEVSILHRLTQEDEGLPSLSD